MEDVIGMIVPVDLSASDPYAQKARRRYEAGQMVPCERGRTAFSLIRRPDNGNAKQS